MPEHAAITGDLVRSTARDDATRGLSAVLAEVASRHGAVLDRDFAVFQGDSFQGVTSPDAALAVALDVQVTLLHRFDLEARISIGIGPVDTLADTVLESVGPAFTRSGRRLAKMRSWDRLVVTGDTPDDRAMNVGLALVTSLVQTWTRRETEVVYTRLTSPDWTQQRIADALGVSRPAISQALTRAGWKSIRALTDLWRDVHGAQQH